MVVLGVGEAAHLTHFHILLILNPILPDLIREFERIHFCHEVVLPLINTLMMLIAPKIGRMHLVIIVTYCLEFDVLAAHLHMLKRRHLFHSSSAACLSWLCSSCSLCVVLHLELSGLVLIHHLLIIEEKCRLDIGWGHGLGRHRHDLIFIILLQTLKT